jgi:hypothetical protein
MVLPSVSFGPNAYTILPAPARVVVFPDTEDFVDDDDDDEDDEVDLAGMVLRSVVPDFERRFDVEAVVVIESFLPGRMYLVKPQCSTGLTPGNADHADLSANLSSINQRSAYDDPHGDTSAPDDRCNLQRALRLAP